MTGKTKRAFSYIRFSDKKQAMGDSLRRQLEWGPALAAARGWVLDTDLKLHDLGVSAFRGKNAATGALAGFLAAVKEGRVSKGDVLLLESLDRLSREDIDPAWETFRSILKAGVEIYTREPERHYVPADLSNFGTRIEVQAYMLRAFNESATKSMRGVEFWKRRRAILAEGKVIHQVVPAWLRLSEDRTRFEVIPEASKAIRLIYRWAGQGMGLNPITHRLNREGVPPIGNNIRRTVFKDGWRRSYVAKLLSDRAVVGEYQPHTMKMVPVDPNDPDGPTRQKRVPQGSPVPHYFPQIISEDEWFRVRHAVKERGRQLGPKGIGIASLFTGLIRDARDGQVMHMTYAGSSRANNSRTLVSYGCRNGLDGSVHRPFPYDPVERGVLQVLRELKPTDLRDNQAGGPEEEIDSLRGRVEELDDKIAAVQQRVMNERGVEALLTLLEKLDGERKAAAAEIRRLREEAVRRQPRALEETQSLLDVLDRTEGEARKAIRTKLKARIRQVLREIWVLTWDVTPTLRAAEVQVTYSNGKVRQLLFAWLRRGRHRGLVEGIGMLLSGTGKESRLANKRLSNYRTDLATREFYDRHHERLNPAIIKYIEAEKELRDADAAVLALET